MKFLLNLFLVFSLLFGSQLNAGWGWSATKTIGKAGMAYGAKKGLDAYLKNQPKKSLSKVGRKGKEARLKELANNDKVSSADRGWIRQELNAKKRGNSNYLRNPKGKDLAHERGREAAKGYGYEHANLQNTILHKTQHKFDDYGRKNKERPIK